MPQPSTSAGLNNVGRTLKASVVAWRGCGSYGFMVGYGWIWLEILVELGIMVNMVDVMILLVDMVNMVIYCYIWLIWLISTIMVDICQYY